MSDDEVLAVEAKFNFEFPPDLKLFLQTALPISDSFVNWRLGLTSSHEVDLIRSRFDWPLEGMLFDVQSNGFWVDSWGKKSGNDNDKVKIVRKNYSTYSKQIPIYSHRYLPSWPLENGNPVFSIYQMDIVYYGYNLATYFANEFKFTLTDDFEILDYPKKGIGFWSDWTK